MDDDAASSCKRIKGVAELPEELVEEILSHLPARSLLRFQCVSRRFLALITSRAFRDAHLRRHGGAGGRLFLTKPAMIREPLYAWQPGGEVERMTTGIRRLPQGSIFPVSSRCCRGLILLRCPEYQEHIVWNPSTGETLTLPDRVPAGTGLYMLNRHNLRVSYGLGYCSATQQHKVVRVFCTGRFTAVANFCEVFTLNGSGFWRPALTNPPQYVQGRILDHWRQGAVFCNGNLHFLHYGGDITTFNITDETFGALKPPPELQCSYKGDYELTELRGCLCAYTSAMQWDWESNDAYELWLLRDYGTSGNWEKIQCFDDRGTLFQGRSVRLKPSWVGPLDMYYDGSGRMKIIFGTSFGKVFIMDLTTRTPEILLSPNDDEVISGSQHDDPDPFPTMGWFQESLARVNSASQKHIFPSPSMQAWSEVLSWLPARTVRRLKQVCKGWRSLIKSERFIATHLHRVNMNKSPQVMFINGGATPPYVFELLDYFMNNTQSTPPLIDDDLMAFCSSPCHGLNAVSFGNYDFICNPITGYVKVLPVDESGERKEETMAGPIVVEKGDEFAGRLGLGYEKDTSRHVLVRLVYEEDLATQDRKLVCKMRYIEDILWDDVEPPPRPIANTPPAHMNGRLYWMADLDPQERLPCHEIVVLNVSTRKFEVIQGPPCDDENNKRVSIVKLEEVIAVAFLRQSTCTMEIWQMEHTVGPWFVKYRIELGRFSLEYLPELVTPLAIDPKDRRILLSTGRALGYYDTRTMELQTIYRLAKHIKGKKFVPTVFVESLVHPNHTAVEAFDI